MNRVLTRVGWTTLALAGLLGTNLQAGDVEFSLRGGIGTERKDGVKDALAIGIGYNWEFAKGHNFLAEFGYLYQPGYNQNVPLVTNSIGAVTGVNSANAQKLTAQGLNLRGLYRGALSGPWSWQGGVLVGSMKSRMDATGDIRGSDGTQAGGWAISPEAKSTSLAPFLGFDYNLGELGHVEMNIVSLNYKQVTLTPYYVPGGSGTNRVTPVIGEKSVSFINLEIGISFRF